VLRGVDGLRTWFTEIDEQFGRWQLDVDEIREANPDRLLVLGSIHLRGRESGVEFEQPMAWLIDFREGRLLRIQMYVDRSEALAAAGLG
jgi:ketosteroid isomerase-like protein